MEELLIKYLDNQCSPAELAEVNQLLEQDAELKSEIMAMKRMDAMVGKGFEFAPEPGFSEKLRKKLHHQFAPSSPAYKDFIIPGSFILGSIIYLILQNGGWTSQTSTIDLPNLSQYFNIGFISLLGITLLYFLDDYLSKKKHHTSLKMWSL